MIYLVSTSVPLTDSTGKSINNQLLPGESVNNALKSTIGLVNMPRFFKKLLASYYRSRDPVYAGLLGVMHSKSILEERQLVVKRDEFRQRWNDQWIDEGLDFVLTVTSPFPALANGTSEKASMMSAGYTFLFSLVSGPYYPSISVSDSSYS
jgi:hypothetical protein